MDKSERFVLDTVESYKYLPLLFQAYKPYLLNCERENIIAVGAKDAEGKPCGLILAATSYDENGVINNSWILLSVFVSVKQRRKGIGRSLWEQLRNILQKKGCRELKVQSVLTEAISEVVCGYLVAMGFLVPKRIAKIFSFDDVSIWRSPFVSGSFANAFQPDESFRYLSFDELTEEQIMELENNEGDWYPGLVNPLIGKDKINKRCTVFALDNSNNRIAGWITAIDVNENKRILYRTFFTREEYRDTPVGFFIFTQAIKNHLLAYPHRGGLSSIPTDNEKAMRFSALFFRDAYDHISYEIASSYYF